MNEWINLFLLFVTFWRSYWEKNTCKLPLLSRDRMKWKIQQVTLLYSAMRCSFSHLFWYFSSELCTLLLSLSTLLPCILGHFLCCSFPRLFAMGKCLSLAIFLRSGCWCNWDWGLKCFSHSIQDCMPPQFHFVSATPACYLMS